MLKVVVTGGVVPDGVGGITNERVYVPALVSWILPSPVAPVSVMVPIVAVGPQLQVHWSSSLNLYSPTLMVTPVATQVLLPSLTNFIATSLFHAVPGGALPMIL